MIGIFGGTFDPIHLGHLQVAQEVQQRQALQEIRFIPCKIPVHKSAAYATSAQRLAMLTLAVAGQPGWVVDERELQRATPSYMYDTVCSLAQDFPHRQFGLILGSDAAQNFTTWYQWETLLDKLKLFVVPRNGVPASRLPAIIRQHMEWIEMETLPISSHEIRAAVAAGQSIRHWVTERVWQYIQAQHLYYPPHGLI